MHFKELFKKKNLFVSPCHFLVNLVLKCLQLNIFPVPFHRYLNPRLRYQSLQCLKNYSKNGKLGLFKLC